MGRLRLASACAVIVFALSIGGGPAVATTDDPECNMLVNNPHGAIGLIVSRANSTTGPPADEVERAWANLSFNVFQDGVTMVCAMAWIGETQADCWGEYVEPGTGAGMIPLAGCLEPPTAPDNGLYFMYYMDIDAVTGDPVWLEGHRDDTARL